MHHPDSECPHFSGCWNMKIRQEEYYKSLSQLDGERLDFAVNQWPQSITKMDRNDMSGKQGSAVCPQHVYDIRNAFYTCCTSRYVGVHVRLWITIASKPNQAIIVDHNYIASHHCGSQLQVSQIEPSLFKEGKTSLNFDWKSKHLLLDISVPIIYNHKFRRNLHHFTCSTFKIACTHTWAGYSGRHTRQWKKWLLSFTPILVIRFCISPLKVAWAVNHEVIDWCWPVRNAASAS